MCGLVYPQILLGRYLEQTKVFWGESTHTDTDVLVWGVHYGHFLTWESGTMLELLHWLLDLTGLDTKSEDFCQTYFHHIALPILAASPYTWLRLVCRLVSTWCCHSVVSASRTSKLDHTTKRIRWASPVQFQTSELSKYFQNADDLCFNLIQTETIHNRVWSTFHNCFLVQRPGPNDTRLLLSSKSSVLFSVQKVN